MYVARVRSQEISSCLLRYFRLRQSEASHLILFSDACGGQNRNINIVCLWMYVVSSPDYSYALIDHKFMISGHSYLPNDRDLGSIERANRRTQHVFVPEHWCNLVETARKQNPFHVVRMTTNVLYRLETLGRKSFTEKTTRMERKLNG